MHRYEKYKYSGIEWIGEIPEHWVIKKFSHISYMKGRIGWQGLKQSEFTNNEEDPFLITGMNFHSGLINWDEVYHITEERYNEAPEIQLKKCDVLITKDGTIGKLLYVDEIPYPFKASLNSHLLVLRPLNNEYNQKYLYYQLHSILFKHHIELTKTGTTFFGISQDAMGQYKMLIPSFHEQTAIAKYLDRETRKIDELISNKKRLLELYEEEKSVIINNAVTKGINADVPMKNSGVEWLGEIPEHWNSVSLKWITNIYSGGTPSKNKPEFWKDGTIPWINSGTVNQEYITIPSEYITEEALENSSAKWIPEKSLVMALAGQGKTKGMVAQVQFKTTCNQSLGVIVPNEKIDNRFLMYWLKKNYQNIRNLGGGDKRDGINLEMIGNIPVPITNLQEQKAIILHIEKKITLINAKIEKTKKLIGLLNEYHMALISEVITGKIKVIE